MTSPAALKLTPVEKLIFRELTDFYRPMRVFEIVKAIESDKSHCISCLNKLVKCGILAKKDEFGQPIYSVASPHQPVASSHQSVASPHQPVASSHQPVASPHQSVASSPSFLARFRCKIRPNYQRPRTYSPLRPHSRVFQQLRHNLQDCEQSDAAPNPRRWSNEPKTQRVVKCGGHVRSRPRPRRECVQSVWRNAVNALSTSRTNGRNLHQWFEQKDCLHQGAREHLHEALQRGVFRFWSGGPGPHSQHDHAKRSRRVSQRIARRRRKSERRLRRLRQFRKPFHERRRESVGTGNGLYIVE